MGVLAGAAALIGAPETAIRLLFTLFAGYPLAFIYRRGFYKKSPALQHLFFALAGFGLICFNFGWQTWHSVFSVILAYLICRYLPGTGLSVILAFVFFMGHLLLGYYATETERYDITWTMPHCVLTLRLIGLVWDVYDGSKEEKELSADQKETALKQRPSLLEVFAYTYFFGGFLVGPQFPLSRFRKLVNGEFADPKTGEVRDSLVSCLQRLLPATLYMIVHFILYASYPNSMFTTSAFTRQSLFWKSINSVIWFRVIIFKYQAVWLIAEGVNIYCTLAFNGTDAKGRPLWNGVCNVHLKKMDLGCSFQSAIESFNRTTNQWAAKYVYKRLIFLGNRTASHFLTLLFLASWHGFHLGYFVCFLCEFIDVVAEKQLVELVKRVPALDKFCRGPVGKIPTWIICKTITTLAFVYAFLSFGLIKTEIWWPVYKEFYCAGWIAFGVVWPITYQILIRILPKQKKDTEKED